MLVIPEHQTIVILPPRTGSSSIHEAVAAVSPGAFMLYRHAEADAIPPGYDGYRVTGFVRHPLARMWSLYKFCATLDPRTSATWAQEEVLRLAESVQGRNFDDWLLNNVELFLPAHTGHPGLYQTHYMPETRKSQHFYLRPDLGTEIVPFSELAHWMESCGLPVVHTNDSPRLPIPPNSPAIELHLAKYMSWELSLGLEVL